MAIEIFPTEGDVGGSGIGETATESAITSVFEALHKRRNFIISGMVPTDTAGSNLFVEVAAGEALIDGYRVEFTATETVTVNNNEAEQFWFIELVRSSGLVTGIQWVRVLAHDYTDIDDRVLVFGCDSSSGDITGGLDFRQGCPMTRRGQYTGSGGSKTISLDFWPTMVLVAGLSVGTRDDIMGLSKPLRIDSHDGFYVDSSGSGITQDSHRVPKPMTKNLGGIGSIGFEVNSHGSQDNLNESGETYNYIVFP